MAVPNHLVRHPTIKDKRYSDYPVLKNRLVLDAVLWRKNLFNNGYIRPLAHLVFRLVAPSSGSLNVTQDFVAVFDLEGRLEKYHFAIDFN